MHKRRGIIDWTRSRVGYAPSQSCSKTLDGAVKRAVVASAFGQLMEEGGALGEPQLHVKTVVVLSEGYGRLGPQKGNDISDIRCTVYPGC